MADNIDTGNVTDRILERKNIGMSGQYKCVVNLKLICLICTVKPY